MPVKSVRINTNAKAITSRGAKLSRAQILAQLGLDPKTPPEAWLAVVACGSNASALRVPDANSLLNAGKVRSANFHPTVLAKLQRRG
jgi:hypothetical protein